VVDAMAPVCLLHREHGGTGIAAGLYVVRRQREADPAAGAGPPPADDGAPRYAAGVEQAQAAQSAPRIRYVVD